MRYVRQSAWLEIKKELFENSPMCKVCRIRLATDLHHAIISKAKVRRRKFHKYLDHKYNALELCKTCHKVADGYDTRKMAWDINCKRYTYKNMVNWYASLPLRIKEKFKQTEPEE